MKNNLGLHLLKNPNETYSFVGSVPVELAFVTKAGNTVSPEEVTAQLLLPTNYRYIKSRTFTCIEDAIREAQRLNYIIDSIVGGTRP